MSSSKIIDLAIIGAGITSLTLAHGLLKNPNINFTIYEARPKLAEDGTGVGIASNGREALSLISSELRSTLDTAGAVRNVPEVRFMLAHSNTKIRDFCHEPTGFTVVRSRWVKEMLKGFPEEVVVTGKRLEGIEQLGDGGGIRLHFEDGEEKIVDALIGCDGINSFVRRHVLTPDHVSTVDARWSPSFDTRIMIPISQARQIFGEAYCNDQTQTGWIGENGFCLTDFEDEGKTMQVIAGFRFDKPVMEVYGQPFAVVEKDFWLKRLQGWGWIGECVSRVVESQEKVWAASGRVHPPTPTYVKGRMCIAGDAARSLSPARGNGASQGIEDALVLVTVLESIASPEELGKAFEVYDRLRRPRREQVADYSSQGGQLLTGRDPEVGIDVEKLRAKTERWNDIIYEYDVAELQRKSRELMNK